MADYATMRMQELLRVFYSLKPEDWRHAADNWRAMATGINETQTSLDLAWQNTPVFHLNDHDPEAVAFRSFEDNVGFSHRSAQEWGGFATNVANRLVATATVIEGNRPFVDAAARDYERASKDAEKEVARLRAALYVWNVSNAVRDTFNGVPVPAQSYQGPLGQRQNENAPGGGDPNAPAGAAGAGGGTPGGGDVGPGGEKPAAAPAAPKAPEAKDPIDQADKLLGAVGKGIDLLGKPAEVADKYVGLAQHLKDLLGAGGAGGTGTEGLDPDSLIPDDLYTPDQPTLAGGAGTAPTFDPGLLTGGGGSAGAGGLPSTPVASLGAAGPGAGLGATGSVGSAPSLAGKATSASAAGGQQSMPPMYPPMGGMGAMGAGAAGGGRGDIKPGTAVPRAGGFSLPAEQSESERWSRHGVQADLQGRAGDEHRTASAVPALRKRKGSARTAKPAEQDVLDEELWRL